MGKIEGYSLDRDHPTTRADMLHRIAEAIQCLEADEIRRAVDNFQVRVQASILQDEAHSEH